MHCPFCKSWNASEEHRCSRCGRRLDGTITQEVPVHVVNGALAHAAVMKRIRVAAQDDTVDAPQGSLFSPGAAPSNVIEFQPPHGRRPAPPAPRPPAAPPAHPPTAEPPRTPAQRRQSPPARSASDTQGSLDFIQSTIPAPRRLGTKVEASIFCESPVATALHRMVAAFLDIAMILIGYGLFLGAFYAAGGRLAADTTSYAVAGVSLLLIALIYGLLWVLCNGETAGMRWVHLTLVDFDGARPDRAQRLSRFLGTCVSAGALTMGLWWALADEESLAWQDHISKTFPTPRHPGSNFYEG